jgi:hypothetical protein
MIEETKIDVSEPGRKLFSVGQITLATFLGAPIAGCLLLARNYRELGKGAAARHSLVAGVASTIVILTIAFFLPENFPNAVLPVAYCFGMRQLVMQLQGGAIDNHLQAGGRKGSWVITVVLGLGCSVIILGLIFALTLGLNL